MGVKVVQTITCDVCGVSSSRWEGFVRFTVARDNTPLLEVDVCADKCEAFGRRELAKRLVEKVRVDG